MSEQRHDWNRLNHHQLGKYAEYLTKMEFVLHGCDVFTSEVDNHGIDFVVRTSDGEHYDIQVKSFRSDRTDYIFMPKSSFRIHRSSLLVAVQFVQEQQPKLFLVPSCVGDAANPIFVSRDYIGKKSAPEWGLALTKKTMAALEKDCGFHAAAWLG